MRQARCWLYGCLLAVGAVALLLPAGGSAGAQTRPAIAHGPDGPAEVQQQGTWRLQSSGTGRTLRAVDFVDERRGWAVGGEREGEVAIVHTEDGGSAWQTQNSPVAQRLYSVSFWDGEHGWAGGDAGVILRTTDGGRSWHPQDSGTTSTIVSLAAVGPDMAFAAVRGGNIRRTRDGGASWERVQGTSGIGLFAVAFVDQRHGWVSGSEGLIARTSDGGDSWFALPSGSSGRVTDISMADVNNGWAVGNSVLRTTDGTYWRMQSRPDPDQKSLNAVCAIDARTAFAVGDEGRAFSTRDGGETWVREALPRRVSLNGVDFAGICNGWAVGWAGTILRYQQPCAVPSVALPSTATASPVPPTSTPTQTPTITPSPTPSVPWARWQAAGPILVSEVGTGRSRLVYGSMPIPVVISGTVAGAATFAGGGDSLTTSLFSAAGSFEMLLAPRTGAVAGETFELHVDVSGVPLQRRGVIARSVFLPTIGR